MPRIRSIHPSFFTHEECVSCSPLARLLYIGLWTDADDQGIFEWRPLQLKMRLLPGDPCDTAGLLTELLNAGLIAPFEHRGSRFGAIHNFRKFQRPKKPNRVHFLPPEWRTYVALDDQGSEPAATYERQEPNDDALSDDEFRTGGGKPPQMEDEGEDVGKEEERKKRGDAPERRATRIPPDWAPSELDRSYAARQGFSPVATERIAEKFRNFWKAKSGKGAAKLDWVATWQNWVLEEAERRGLQKPARREAEWC